MNLATLEHNYIYEISTLSSLNINIEKNAKQFYFKKTLKSSLYRKLYTECNFYTTTRNISERYI